MEGNQTATATFLRAEEAASRLAEELKRLDSESQRYGDAATTLSAAGERLKALAEAVRGNTEQTTEVVTAIRSVGSPAIIDGLNQLNTTVGETREAVQRALAAIEDLARVSGEHGQQLLGIGSTVASELSATRSAVDDQAEKTRGALEKSVSAATAANKAAGQELAAVKAALKELSDHQSGRLALVLILAGLAVLLSAVAAIGAFLR